MNISCAFIGSHAFMPGEGVSQMCAYSTCYHICRSRVCSQIITWVSVHESGEHQSHRAGSVHVTMKGRL
jgi:hypothetical protein